MEALSLRLLPPDHLGSEAELGGESGFPALECPAPAAMLAEGTPSPLAVGCRLHVAPRLQMVGPSAGGQIAWSRSSQGGQAAVGVTKLSQRLQLPGALRAGWARAREAGERGAGPRRTRGTRKTSARPGGGCRFRSLQAGPGPPARVGEAPGHLQSAGSCSERTASPPASPGEAPARITWGPGAVP